MKKSLHTPKTCLVLILGILFSVACSPAALAKQANSPVIAAVGGEIQPVLIVVDSRVGHRFRQRVRGLEGQNAGDLSAERSLRAVIPALAGELAA